MVLATPALTAPRGFDALLTLADAGRSADEDGAAAISPERLLLSLIAPVDGSARRLLEALAVDAGALVERMTEAVRFPSVPDEPGRFDSKARALLSSAAAEARARRDAG
jgi:hypothetical protein